jgi:hypothetical protein
MRPLRDDIPDREALLGYDSLTLSRSLARSLRESLLC